MKKQAKRILSWLGLLALLTGMALSVPAESGTDAAEEVYRQEIPASAFADEYMSYGEDGSMELLVNEAQCLLMLEDRTTGRQWPLVPTDVIEDPLASKNTAEAIQAHLHIRYCADDGVEMTMNSYSDCVSKSQYRLFALANGVRVEYTLGTPPDQRFVLPQLMAVEDYEEITAFYAQNDKVLRRLKYFYSLVTLSSAQSAERRQEQLDKYPALEKQDLYVSRSMTVKEKRELEGYFTEAGFTLTRVDDIYAKLGFQEESESKPYFVIPVDYTLENGVFAAEIASGEITHNEDYYLETITLLPYFGAKNNEEGYLFIPDGCGSLVRFGEGYTNDRLYMTGKVYGDDISVEQTTETITYRLPVFGIKGEQDALFANITSGASCAEITAQSGGSIDSYYTAYATYTYHNKFVHVLSNGNVEQDNWPVFAKKPNSDPFRVEYSLLTGDEANTAGMAATYRRYLFGDRAPQASQEATMLYLTTLGQINETGNILGIAYETDTALTTFEEIQSITAELTEAGIPAITVQMTGWYNGGLNYTAPSKLRVSNTIGGKAGLQALLQADRDTDSLRVFPAVDLGFVMRTDAFDGFSSVRDAARTIEGRLTTKRPLNLAINKLEDTGRMVINAKSAVKYAEAVRRFLAANGGGAVSLLGLGSVVYGSYKENAYMRRETAIAHYTALLEKQTEAGDIMVAYGNAYTLPYVTDVLEIPTEDSQLPGYGERVAFLQMVLRGQVRYAVSAINLSEDVDRQLLRCVEMGAYPSFTVAAQNLYSLRTDPCYNRYYAVDYAVLADTITDSYQRVAAVLDRVTDSGIAAHGMVDKQVYRTDYENGVSVLVNYRQTDYTDAASGTTVPAGGWIVL